MKHPTVEIFQKIQIDLDNRLKKGEIVKKYAGIGVTRYIFKKFYEKKENLGLILQLEEGQAPKNLLEAQVKLGSVKNEIEVAKKKAFLKKYQSTFGNVSESCKSIAIKRQTYNRWIVEDDEFKNDLLETTESTIDLAETKLIIEVNDGNIQAIKYLLDNKGASRGYGPKAIERPEDDDSDIEDYIRQHMEKSGVKF